MMAAGEDAIALLRSIDASLKQLVSVMVATAPKPVASDRDLDGKFGDPVLKFTPRDWTGMSYTGCRMSECPAELLDMLAATFDYFAQQADEKHEMTAAGRPVGDYKRTDAARARGWAKRKRAGWTVPASALPTGPGDDNFDDVPSGF